MNPHAKKNYTSLGGPVPNLTRYCFGATVKAARERARWSQAECSGKIGMTSTWWCHLEQGRNPKKHVRGKQLALAARGLGMTQVALLKMCMEQEQDAPLDPAWGKLARLAMTRGITPKQFEAWIRAAPEGPPLALPDTGLVDPEAPPSPMEDMAAYRARMDRAAQVERERLYLDRRAQPAMPWPGGVVALPGDGDLTRRGLAGLAAREAMTEQVAANQPAERVAFFAAMDAVVTHIVDNHRDALLAMVPPAVRPAADERVVDAGGPPWPAVSCPAAWDPEHETDSTEAQCGSVGHHCSREPGHVGQHECLCGAGAARVQWCSMVWPVLDGDTCAPSGMHSCTQTEGHEHDHACKCGDLR